MINKLLLGIDVFSLGFSIASLFTINVDLSLMNKIKKSSPMIRDFFKLFRNMCENYTDRYTSEQAYNTFVKLLDFYSPESKKKNPKSKIQKKKTPKKKKVFKEERILVNSYIISAVPKNTDIIPIIFVSVICCFKESADIKKINNVFKPIIDLTKPTLSLSLIALNIEGSIIKYIIAILIKIIMKSLKLG